MSEPLRVGDKVRIVRDDQALKRETIAEVVRVDDKFIAVSIDPAVTWVNVEAIEKIEEEKS
jgi:hypothetical protein